MIKRYSLPATNVHRTPYGFYITSERLWRYTVVSLFETVVSEFKGVIGSCLSSGIRRDDILYARMSSKGVYQLGSVCLNMGVLLTMVTHLPIRRSLKEFLARLEAPDLEKSREFFTSRSV